MTMTSTTVAAIVAVAIGAATFVSPTLAEQPGERGFFIHREMGPMRGGLLDMACSPDAAERLEIAFVRLSHAITLTEEQKTLFDDLRNTALTAQTAFADTCEGTISAGEKPGMVERLQTRIAIQTAELEAWNAVMPKLEAFVDGLTDEQRAALEPKREHLGFNDDREGGDGPHFRLFSPNGAERDGEGGTILRGPGFKFHFGPGSFEKDGPVIDQEPGHI